MNVPVAVTTIALLDDENAVECPECHAAFTAFEPTPARVELPLRAGKMYAAYCPECNHGVYVRGIPDDDGDE